MPSYNSICFQKRKKQNNGRCIHIQTNLYINGRWNCKQIGPALNQLEFRLVGQIQIKLLQKRRDELAALCVCLLLKLALRFSIHTHTHTRRLYKQPLATCQKSSDEML